MKHVIVAVDSFKGSLSARKVSEAIAKSFSDIIPECKLVVMPISDGGECLAENLSYKLEGKLISVKTTDALMRPITTNMFVYKDLLVMDMASSSGLNLLSAKEMNPMNTTTYGVGIMIKEAISLGYKNILLGLGGSATNDAGLGMMQALGAKIIDKGGHLISNPIVGSMLNDISIIDLSNILKEMNNVHITVACDVQNVFSGKNGAAYIFAKQKGADQKEVEILDRGLVNINRIFMHQFHKDANIITCSGAAGGMGAALSILLKAELKSGIECVLDVLNFNKFMRRADLVITGEGKIDNQSFMGKTLFGILKHAREFSVPVLVIGGQIENKSYLNELSVEYIECSSKDQPLHISMRSDIAFNNIYKCMKIWLSDNINKY